MEQRPEGRSTAQRLCLLGASLVLGSIGWILMGESENLTAAESPEESRVMARVDGVAITEEAVQRTAARALHLLEAQRKEILAEALRQEVESQLLEAEASRRGMTREELLAVEVESHLTDVTEQELAEYASQQEGEHSTEELHTQFFAERRNIAYKNLVAQLMERSKVEVESTPSLPPEVLAAGAIELARLGG